MDHEYPAGYKRYRVTHKDEKSEDHLRLVKFGERYRFAGQLAGVRAHGYSDSVVSIYAEALRVSLAYSAFEQLTAVRGLKGVTSVKLPKLAVTFRNETMRKFRNFLIMSSGDGLSAELERLTSDKNNSNVLPIIAGIRHAMFHGALTPGSMGFSSKASLRFLEELSQGLFAEMDRLFGLLLSSKNE